MAEEVLIRHVLVFWNVERKYRWKAFPSCLTQCKSTGKLFFIVGNRQPCWCINRYMVQGHLGFWRALFSSLCLQNTNLIQNWLNHCLSAFICLFPGVSLLDKKPALKFYFPWPLFCWALLNRIPNSCITWLLHIGSCWSNWTAWLRVQEVRAYDLTPTAPHPPILFLPSLVCE